MTRIQVFMDQIFQVRCACSQHWTLPFDTCLNDLESWSQGMWSVSFHLVIVKFIFYGDFLVGRVSNPLCFASFVFKGVNFMKLILGRKTYSFVCDWMFLNFLFLFVFCRPDMIVVTPKLYNFKPVLILNLLSFKVIFQSRWNFVYCWFMPVINLDMMVVQEI